VSGHNIAFPAAPLIDPDTGDMALVWRSFFLALWNRTGAAQPATSLPGISAQLAAETAARIAGDQAQATALAAETTARIAAINAEAATRVSNDAWLAQTAGGGAFPMVTTGGDGGPTWTAGAGVPTATAPVGSIYSRSGGALGNTFYVSRGGGVWHPVAAV
jgi:hypothetical protein